MSGTKTEPRLRGISEIIMAGFIDRALRQIRAAGSRGVRWYFAEEQAADYVRRLLNQYDEGRGAIDVQYRPHPRAISGRGE